MRSFLLPLTLATLAPALLANGDPVPGEPSITVADGLEKAMSESRTWLNLRYRHEHVVQDGKSRHANASTLRTAFGMETGTWNGVSALIEVTDVRSIGPDNYNSTVNGKTGYPVVADPEETQINQVFADIGNKESTYFRLGRQEITLDNQRFIGNVGWRQNHQSYDAAGLLYKAGDGTMLQYTYVDNVNRIFGESSPMGDVRSDSHILHLSQDLEGVGKASAYWYDLDLAGLPLVSTRTWGVRLDGQHAMSGDNELLYKAEYAQQKDVGDNPGKVDQDYILTELGAKMGNFTVRVARETLGGSGDVINGTRDAFSTPLATLHAFNGYADVFLNTPAGGLVDDYFVLSTEVSGVKASVAYHDFDSDAGSVTYGDEIDATLVYPYSDRTTIGLKLAWFESKNTAFSQTTKVMGWVSFKVL